jgi:hypothetical protein
MLSTTGRPDITATQKKFKKATISNTGTDNETRLEKRKRRFEREHEIEKQKASGILSGSQFTHHSQSSTGFDIARDNTPTYTPMAYRSAGAISKRKYANAASEDVGDGDPVRTESCLRGLPLTSTNIECYRLG